MPEGKECVRRGTHAGNTEREVGMLVGSAAELAVGVLRGGSRPSELLTRNRMPGITRRSESHPYERRGSA